MELCCRYAGGKGEGVGINPHYHTWQGEGDISHHSRVGCEGALNTTVTLGERRFLHLNVTFSCKPSLIPLSKLGSPLIC